MEMVFNVRIFIPDRLVRTLVLDNDHSKYGIGIITTANALWFWLWYIHHFRNSIFCDKKGMIA